VASAVKRNVLPSCLADDENDTRAPPRTARKAFLPTTSKKGGGFTTSKKVPSSDVKGALSSRKLFGELDTNREGRGESKPGLRKDESSVKPEPQQAPQRKVRFEHNPVNDFVEGGWRDDDEPIEMPAGMPSWEQAKVEEEERKKQLEELEKQQAKEPEYDLAEAFKMPWFREYEEIAKTPFRDFEDIKIPPHPPRDSPANPFKDLPPVDGPPICEDFAFELDEDDIIDAFAGLE